MGRRKVADVYRTQKVGEVHKKDNYSWVIWLVVAIVILGAIS